MLASTGLWVIAFGAGLVVVFVGFSTSLFRASYYATQAENLTQALHGRTGRGPEPADVEAAKDAIAIADALLSLPTNSPPNREGGEP